MLPVKPETSIEEPRAWLESSSDPSVEHKGFYRRAGKRLLDVAISAVGLILCAPLYLVIAFCIKCGSPGPVFFRQARVGKEGSRFQLLKFRSMAADAERRGPPLTATGDSRISRVGAFLRRYKLDELPQLWNVLKGDMSLVGPRPELERYVEWYTQHQRRVLDVRPGITDLASLTYLHEEELLSMQPHPEEFYREFLLPHKLALDLAYVEEISFREDVLLILRTLGALFDVACVRHLN
jgi:lipopolysaccharide/colanic/teichoic acid biosynthesis glycosyltransferase